MTMNDDTMTMNDEQPRLHAALGKVADSFELPDFDELCEHAVRHGRRTVVRRRAFGAGIGVLALAGVAVGATGTVTSSHVARGLGRTAPVVTVSNGDLAEYMAKNLVALLPAGSTLVEGGDRSPVEGWGLQMGPTNGDWELSASAVAMYQGKKTLFEVAVVQQERDSVCATPPSGSAYHCTSTMLDGHTLISASSNVDDGESQAWMYTWNLGDGKLVELTADQELSASLAATVVTAPAWTSVAEDLPAYVDCPTLGQVREATATVWKCAATGETYPLVPSDVYLYPSS